MNQVVVYIDAPLLTPEEFGRRCGLTERQVKRRIEDGLIPSVHLVKEGFERGVYMVNNAKMIQDSLNKDMQGGAI